MRRRLGGIGFALALIPAACTSDLAPAETASEVPTASATATAEPAPTAAPTESPPPTATVAPEPTELETIVTDFIGDEPGGIIVLARVDGVVETVAIGDADAEGTPLTATTPMRVGSISKPFVAAMVLQLVESGEIDLDATIGTYLGSPPLGSDVTVQQLLEHRSGLANYTEQPELWALVESDPTRRLSRSEVLDLVADIPGLTPGALFSYSNTNYLLAGSLIEAFDVATLEDSLQQRIAGPAGLTSTHFDLGDGVDGVPGFWSAAGMAGEPDFPYTAMATGAWAAGALVSTAPDLLRFLDALRDGTLVSAESYEAMASTFPDNYGLGLSHRMLGASGPGVGHDGGILGFLSVMAIDRDSDDSLIVLTNNDQIDPDRLANRILSTW